MKDSSISLLTFGDDILAKKYLEMNAIKGAFVWKEDDRRWQCLEGNPRELIGFVCGEFKTKRAAKEKADKINERIKFLNP